VSGRLLVIRHGHGRGTDSFRKRIGLRDDRGGGEQRTRAPLVVPHAVIAVEADA